MNEETREGTRLDRLAPAILVAIVAAVFADLLFFGRRLFMRDLTTYYFATKRIIRDTMLAGELPLWNRLYGGGQPMAANPEYAVFYPPHLLLLLPGYGFWFQVLIVAHVAFGAVGMYRLLRSTRVSGLAALYGAVAFALGGLTASLLNLLPYLFILSWLPWALMHGRRWLLEGDRRSLALAALSFGMQILSAEPTTLVQIWLIVGFCALYELRESRNWSGLGRMSGRLVTMFGLSVGIGAVQLLPAIDHAGDSVRALRFPWETVVSWSAPPWRLVELLIPSFFGRPWFAGEGGYWGSIFYAPRPLPFLFSLYLGFPVLVFATVGFVRGGRLARWVGIGCGAALLLALGSGTPLFRFLYELGPAQSFRYPEKFLITILLLLFFFAMAQFRRLPEERSLVSMIGVGLAVAGAAVSVVAIAFLSGSGGVTFASGVGGAITPSGAIELRDALRADWVVNALRFTSFGVLFFMLRRMHSVQRWMVALLVLGLIDVGVVLRSVSPSIDATLFDEPSVAKKLDEARDEWRVFPLASWYESTGRSVNGARFNETGEGTYWTLRNGMSPMLLSAWGFHQVLEADFDKTALLPTTRLLEALWEIRNRIGDRRDSTLMAMASARYFTRFRDRDTEMARAGSVRTAEPVEYVEVPTNPVYWIPDRIEAVEGRAAFVDRMLSSDPGPRAALIDGEAFEPSACEVVSVVEHTNNARVTVRCEGRSMLVASVTPHKYWSVTVDGAPVDVITTNLAFSGIPLAEGEHIVTMRYWNPVVAVAGVVSLLTALLLPLVARGVREDIG